MSGAGLGARSWRGGAEPSESSPEPPSPSSSRPPPSDSSPSPSEETTAPPHGPTQGRGRAGPGGGTSACPAPPEAGLACDRNLALFEEELATRPRVPALLRRIAPYSALSPDSDDGRVPRRLLGTLRGVAGPSLQTLLGLVLVLRLPWVVGTGGVLQVSAIGLLLGACTVLTAVSLSAIATNGLDPGGCPLGLLSGALGPEAGGAVGLCAFLSAAFAAAAAALGAAEILLVYVAPQAAVLPGRGRGGRLNNGRGYGAGLLGLLGLGAAAPPAARAAPLGPAGLLLALLGLQAGALRAALPGGAPHALCLPTQPGGRLQPCPTARPHGAGGNDTPEARPVFPGPSARLLAQNLWPRPPEPGLGVGPGGAEDEDDDSSFGVLLGLSLPTASGVLWGFSRSGELRDIARSVPAGSLGAALVTALGYLSAALLLGASVEGQLLRDKFWLTSYLGLNLACALQGLLPTPGWSPRCRLYHWGVSLAGAGLCLGLMLVTCWYCALLALGIGATAYKYLEYRGAQSEWGEGLRGLSLSAARFALLRLEDGQPPAPSWRPQLLVLLKLDEELRATQPQLLALAAQLQAGKGLTVVGSVIPGDLPQDQPRARAAEQALRAGLAGAGARGFVQVLVAPGRGPGLAALVQGCGLGALRPNAVLMGWPHGWRRRHDPVAARRFVELLRVAGAGGRALLVAKGPLGAGAPGGTLDVWWVVGDGRLLTLLPLLLRQHPAWRGCRVRLFTVALLEDNSVRLRRLLEAVARRRGLPAQTHVVELHDSDVSAYTYERTLMMEQRSQMLRQMRQAQGGPTPSQAPSAGEEEEEEEERGAPRRGPSPGNVRRMHAAERLNEAVGRCSGGARLVLLDLPPPPPPRPPRPLDNYLEFLEVLTEGLGPVLLVRGGDGDPPGP
ncbi:solute carrier family 12 member 4-like isoform X4 [Buteo buteo]|uniref:solute carrier family 12 member 4-like isoform X4 n=1 Tax=Buteo buteo TaxID=30397 RepID=UPI003EB77BB6